MEITAEIARKVLITVDAGLCRGAGNPVPGQMCVEAAVCYALDLPHSDDPKCVAQSLRRLKIRLNDSNWSSNETRAKGLRRLALAQLGSAGVLDEHEFVRRVVKLSIQTQVPAALRAAALVCKTSHKDKLLTMADLCERDPTAQNACDAREAARAARNAAYAAAAADAAYAADADAAYAAYAAAAAAAYAAADAYAAAAAAAYAAADAYAAAAYAADAYAADAYAAAAYAAAAAAADAYAADAYDDARDRSLAAFAESVVQILIEMKAPGCQWLSMTEVC